jgi:ATP-dependent helicase/DNAse subunit B
MLHSWRQTNGALVASFSSDVGEEGVYPSEFLDLQPADVIAMPSASAKPDVVLEWIEDKASAITSSEAITGGSRLLKNQALCPFKAWTDHRLKLKEPAELVVGLSAAERGALVHQALYYLWGLIEDSETLAKAPPKRREAWIKEAVSGGLRALEADAEQSGVSLRARAGAACLDLEQARLAALMVEWLDTEAQRSVPFEVASREVKASIELAGLTLNLRLDRVDTLSDGRKLVIDYKTGVVQRKALLAERLKEPQLPLYTLLDQNIQGIAYGRVVAGGDSDFTWLGEGLGLKKSSRGADDLASQTRDLVEPVSDWHALRQLWYERLEGLAEEFMAGHVAVTPSSDACRYCAYAGLCRFDDQYGMFSEESEV